MVGLFSCLVAILPKTPPKLPLKPEWLRNDDKQICFMQDVPYLNQHENSMNVSVRYINMTGHVGLGLGKLISMFNVCLW